MVVKDRSAEIPSLFVLGRISSCLTHLSLEVSSASGNAAYRAWRLLRLPLPIWCWRALCIVNHVVQTILGWSPKCARQKVGFPSSIALEPWKLGNDGQSSLAQAWAPTSLAFSWCHSCKLRILICWIVLSCDSSVWARPRSDSLCRTVKKWKTHV